MLKFFNTIKYRMSIIVILALLLQIFMPVIENYAYAQEELGIIEEELEVDEPIEDENVEVPEEEGEVEEPKEEGKESTVPDEKPVEEEPEALDETPKEVKATRDGGKGKDLGNIFIFDFLKLNEEDIKENQVIDIEDNTTVTLAYKWSTTGLTVNPGNWSEIEIPDAFKLDRNWENQDIKLEDETVVGKYSLINNKLKFVFDDGITSVGEVNNGYVNFGLKFNKEKFQEDVVEEIEFNDKEDKTLTIIAKPGGTIKQINKKGTPDADKDAKNITWTIDIANPNNTEITNATIKDIIPAGLSLDKDSVKVKELTIGFDGEFYEGDIVSDILPKDGDNLELIFDKIAPYKGYRIEYTTKIEDFTETQFTNNASLSYGGRELPAKATINVERSAGIEKNGWEIDKNTIQWTIDVNKNGGNINEAIVKDNLLEGLTIVTDSIEIKKLVQSGDSWIEEESDKTATDFPINLGKLGPEDIYRIKFKTEIDYSKVNEGKYQQNNKFINKTELYDGEKKVGENEKDVPIQRDTILEKSGTPIVDYENKEIKWTVTVNKANHKIDNATITDIIPKGLTISESDITVKDSEGKKVTEGITITVPENDGSTATTITINLGNISEKYTIEYTTKITDFKENTFNNKVSLSGTGVGEEGNKAEDPVNPPGNTYSKTKNGIDYNNKTMKWKITINPQREAIKNLKITDTFPNKGLILLVDDENPFEIKLGEKTLVKDIDYTLTSIDGNYKNGFVVKFDDKYKSEPLNALITITYTTSFDPEKGIDLNESPDKYINHAKFEGQTVNGNKIEKEDNDYYQVRDESWNSGKKLGKLVSGDEEGNTVDGWHSGNERKIKWEVYTNYLKQDLGKGIVITDELEYEGKIDKESIKIIKYTVAQNGETTLTEEALTANTDYTTKLSEDGKNLEITFAADFEFNERYAVVFETSVPEISEGVYTNKATLIDDGKEYPYEGSIGFDKANNNLSKTSIGNNGTNVYTDDELNWNIKINEALSVVEKDVKIVDTISKGLVYKKDSLKVYKLIGTDKKEVILGEDYTLTEETTETGETQLIIEFTDSISSTYEIEYTTIVTAIEGQVNNKVEYSGKNLKTKSVETDKLNASQFSGVGGDPSKGKIKVIKVDEGGNTITNLNAKFKLWYELNGEDQQFQDKVFETENGELEIANLPLNRTYYLEEIEAPAGYDLDKARKEIKVTKSASIETYEIKVENKKTKIEVTGTKEWVNGPEDRPTIQLQLYRNGIKHGDPVILENGQTEYTWTDLDLTDENGVAYNYTVDEVEVPENYTKEVSEDGLTITNTYEIPKTTVTGTKVWKGGPESKPTIWFKLYRQTKGGEIEEVPEAEIKELVDGTLEVEWIDLDETDIHGNPYTFLVKEVNSDGEDFELENYTKEEKGLTVTNTYVSPKTTVTGTKVWKGGPKPSIELQLYRDGEAYGKPVTLENGQKEYTWTDLDLTDENGVAYNYTVDEVEVPDNYTKEVSEDGLTITNTYEIPKTEVTGTKVWKGGPKEKPDIELQLYRDGKPFGEPITLKNGQTSYTWDDLDKTDIDGLEYEYTVDEVDVPENYIKEVSEDGLTITNTYVSPEKPTKPSKPTKPTTPQKPALPKTGEASNMILYLVGGAFILLGFILRKRMA